MRNQLFTATLASLGIVLGGASAWADGTETLGPPSIGIQGGTGIVGAGIGLRDGPGTIVIDVPIGASIEQVLLYWSCLATAVNQDNTVTVNTNPVAGTTIGGPTTFFSSTQGVSFRADITALGEVTDGNNMLDIAGLDDCDDNGTNTVNNGAGVLVIFDDGSSAPAVIEVRDGNDLAFINFAPTLDATVPQTFNFAASAVDRTADLVMFFGSVSDGGLRPTSFDVTVNGATTEFNNLLGSNDGGEWDTVNISVLVPAGATMLTIGVFSEDRNSTGFLPASLLWTGAGMALREDEPPSLDGRITGGGSNFRIGDIRITKGLQLHCDLRNPNNFQINWQGNSFHLEQLTGANCTEDPDIIQQPPASSPFDTFQAEGTGRLKIGGVKDPNATVDFVLVDAGEPGVDDTAEIVIRNGNGDIVLDLPVSNLDKGNFQTHKD
ncbi:MAG: hypothetical protein OEM59_02875 [Rhodospirillales bacterium]|nr:hypothetical protein [Rhodospirillales bacterium]